MSSLEVATPERVSLELPIAGVGSRAMAWLVDTALMLAVAMVAYFAVTLLIDPLKTWLDLSTARRVGGVLTLFAMLWLYWTCCELWWDGQTPGKRLMRLRVTRLDGSPVTLIDSAVRNLLRAIDFLPACYPVGAIAMLIDPRHRRLGDLVAGTVVIRDEPIDLGKYETGAASGAHRWLTSEQLELLTNVLARFDDLDSVAQLTLGNHALARLGDAAPPARDSLEARERLRALGGAVSSSPLADFVTSRRHEWHALEMLLTRQRAKSLHFSDISELDRLYRRASADLSVARAAFAGTDVLRFLNRLCGRAYAQIYRRPAEPWRALREFYRRELPLLVQQTWPYTRASMGLMAAGAVLGAIGVAVEPQGSTWLIDANLRDFIERRELWTDLALERMTPGEMATQIFTNNLSVTFKAFALGLTAGIGTVLIVVLNGVQLGALLTACTQRGLGPAIFTFISAHGPVELSIICIAGGAGLVVGHAMVSPQQRSREAWVKERAQLAVKLVLGCAPFLVAVGIVEGFVSPGPFFAWPAKMLFGVASGAAFWRYLLRRV